MIEENSDKTSRRSFLGKAAGAALAATLPASAQSPVKQAPAAGSKSATVVRGKKPLNVLFFMSDDMRPELGGYRSRFNVHSPNIDALGSHGVRFDHNYCQFPLCGPSRSSLFTGHLPRETGAWATHKMAVWPSIIRIGSRCRGCSRKVVTRRCARASSFIRGRTIIMAGLDFDGNTETMHPTQRGTKMVIPPAQIPMPSGVLPPLPQDSEKAANSDEILVLEGNGEGSEDYLVADRAIKMLNQVAADPSKPFFVGCGFSKPHSPPTAPQRFFDMYDPAMIQLPPDFAAWPTVPPGWPKAAIRPRNADLFIGRGASESEAKQVIRAYIASISWVDWNLARVIAELERLKLRDNTVIVFVADHGYQLGENGKWSKAGSLFEGGSSVPLIIDMPGAKGNGRACTRMVQSIDIYRTLAEICHLDVPAGVEGTSLVPLLQDPRGPKWDQPGYTIWSEDGSTIHGTAVRTEQWRYAEYGKEAANGVLLFDMQADPMQLRNLADDPKHAATRAELSKLVNAYSYPA